MKKILSLVCAGGLTLAMGGAIAQDEEAKFQLPSKVVPVEIYACRYNDGQGPSDLDAAVAGFTAYMDKNETDTYAAWTLTKIYSGPDQDFDFIWLGAWTDGNAMGAGTDALYSTGMDMLANFTRVADCYAHTNSASINYKLPEGGTPANAVLTFSNCTINEGQEYAEIAEATSAWADVLTEAGSQVAIYHWFPIRGGGGDSPDFTILQAYPNHTEMGADFERMTNGQLFRQSNELFAGLMDCDVSRVYNARSRRAAQLR
jgi:hypothetical protein